MSSMQIYLARNNVQAGPYTLEQVNNMLASGEVLLEDLAWHEGMEDWKLLGELTHGQFFYDPNNSHPQKKKTVIILDATKEGITKKHDVKKNDAKGHDGKSKERKNKLTVDQLYGRAPVPDNQKLGKDTDGSKNKNDKNDKDDIETHVIRIKLPITDLGGNELATISSRVLAVIIDQIILTLAILPMIMHVGAEKFSQSLDGLLKGTDNSLLESIPTEIAMFSAVLMLAVFVAQTVLLITRGQSVGKLLAGIRILDFETKAVPSATNVLLVRTILFNIAYSLPVVGMPILIIDFLNMVMDRSKRSVHDKVAKTFVAKATEEQIKAKKVEEVDQQPK